jgi:hypothetical protein
MDFDAGTFEAKASGIVLAGLTNPFAVQLGTDQGGPCAMARVYAANPGSYQLTAGDGGEPCALATPIAVPPVAAAGNATDVTFTLNASSGVTLDAGSAQLFFADDNGQPQGAALCTLTDSGNGASTCTVTFNQANPGMVPLLVQATVGGQTVLAPGFAVQVSGPVTDASVQQVNDIQNAMSQLWPTFLQYGDNVYSRMQAMAALRAILPGQVQLTGQAVGLAADGFSIYVRSDCGLPIVLVLDDLADMLPAAEPSHAPARIMASAAAGGASVSAALAAARPMPVASVPARDARGAGGRGLVFEPGLSCTGYTRDIVQNNKVMVWSPGEIFGFLDYRTMVSTLQSTVCPAFQVDSLTGGDATIAAMDQFPNYGTIIMNTHGAWDSAWIFVLSGEPAARNVIQTSNALGIEGTACAPQGCFKTVYPNHPNIHALTNTIIYAGFCHSADNLVYRVGGFNSAMAPPGSQSTYFGYVGRTYSLEDKFIGKPLIDNLVNQYQNTGTAFGNVQPLPMVRGAQPKVLGQAVSPRDILVAPKHFQIWGDQNLAYVGNPSLELRQLNPPVTGAQGIAATLDGTSSCGMYAGSYMSVAWANPAQAGHLTWQTPLENGMEDSFVNYASQPPDSNAMTSAGAVPGNLAIAKYMPSPDLPGTTDNIEAEFYPDPNNPPAAAACLNVNDPAGLFVNEDVATVWNDQKPALRAYEAPVNPPMKIVKTYTVPLQDMVGAANRGAAANITLTNNGQGSFTVDIMISAADPNSLNAMSNPDDGPFMSLAQIILSLINPGAGGKTSVKINGQLHNTTVTETAGTPPLTFTTAAGGTLLIQSQGKSLLSGTLNSGDPKAAPASFTVTADSSCSGPIQPTAQCPAPGAVTLGISFGENLVTIPTSVSFSMTFNIQFVNQ